MGVKSSLWQVRIAHCALYSSIISPGAYAWVGLDGLSHHLDVFSRPPSSSVARVSFIPVQTGSMISILSHIVPDGSFCWRLPLGELHPKSLLNFHETSCFLVSSYQEYSLLNCQLYHVWKACEVCLCQEQPLLKLLCNHRPNM